MKISVMTKDKWDSDLYKDTDDLVESGSQTAEKNEDNCVVLRMEEGMMTDVITAANRIATSVSLRWLVAAVSVLVILRYMLYIALVTGLLFGGMALERYKSHWVQDTLREQVDNLQLQIKAMQNTSTDRSLQSFETQKAVVFSVNLSAGRLRLVSGINILPFDTVTLDSMSAFDMYTHQYTCPVTGTYLFRLCIHNGAIGNDEVRDGDWVKHYAVYVEVGGKRVVEIYTSNSGDNYQMYEHGCNAAIYRCTQGSSVLVKADIKSLMYGTFVQPPIFSGLLLSSD